MSWRENCLWRISQAGGSSDQIVGELADISRDFGFDYCSYVLRLPVPIHSPSVIWASTYPQEWLDHYFSHKYLDIDPMLKRVVKEATPLTWAYDTYEAQPAFWEEANAHGVRFGWASSTHGANYSTGILSLARSSDVVSAKELDESETKLFWLTHLAHGAISSLELTKRQSKVDHELTLREREVLRWTAAGKTSGEIATILGISERTVTFHVTRTLQKLNSVNRTQAVVTAMMRKMLF